MSNRFPGAHGGNEMKMTPERIEEARELYGRDRANVPRHTQCAVCDLLDALDDLKEARKALRDYAVYHTAAHWLKPDDECECCDQARAALGEEARDGR